MPYAVSSESQIYYEKHGTGPALVFAHGGGGNHAIWWQQVPHFSDRYTVITLDYPGFGGSEPQSGIYDLQTFPDVILAVLDHAGIEQAVIVAQSLGGQPALTFAVRHSDRVLGIVLASSLGGISDEEIHSLMLADRVAADELPVLDRLISRQSQIEDPDKVFLFLQMATFNRAIPGKNIQNTRRGTTTVSQVQDLIAAGMDVTFLSGDHDVVRQPSTYQKLAELLPEAHHVVLPGAPHSFYWEMPMSFNDAVDSVLKGLFGEG